VVIAWGISNIVFEDYGLGGYCDATSDRVCLRLDYDRGGIICLVAPCGGKEEFVDVEVLPWLLDRLLHNSGAQWSATPSMSLAAQCDFLIERKREIQIALSSPFWEEAKALVRGIEKQRLRHIFRDMKKQG
jgi:hypothetical protein